jgi:hypothetical protein
MYTSDVLKTEIEHLIRRFNMPILKWSIVPCHFARNLIRLTYYDASHNSNLTMSAEITNTGEVYNPIWFPKYLSYLFDWLLRIGTNQTRTISRTEAYKLELIQKFCIYEMRNMPLINTINTMTL